MLFERFFRTISRVLPPTIFVNVDALAELNPDRIDVENVRSTLRIPYALALKICELAVRQGALKKIIAVECPNGESGAEAEREGDLPPFVTCHSEEGGFVHDVELPTAKLRKVTFYRLANG